MIFDRLSFPGARRHVVTERDPQKLWEPLKQCRYTVNLG